MAAADRHGEPGDDSSADAPAARTPAAIPDVAADVADTAAGTAESSATGTTAATPGSLPDAPPHRPIVRAPLVSVAAALACGIAIARYVQVPLGAWAVLGVVGLAAAIWALRQEHLRPAVMPALLAAILSAGAIHGGLQYWRLPADHVAAFTDRSAVFSTIRGRVISWPEIRQSPAAPWRQPSTSFLLEADGVRHTDGQWQDCEGTLRVSVGEPATLSPGQHVQLVGELTRLRGPSNPGQYDWQQADRYNGIFARFAVPGADGVTVVNDGEGKLAKGWWHVRDLARRHFAATGDADQAMLLDALILGQRSSALETLNRAMVEAGTAHFLSISGSHFAIFLGFVYLLCRLLMLSPRRSAVTALVVLVGYVLLAESQAPLLRSAIMAAAVCVAGISGRSLSTANALSAACVALLIIDPLQLFTASFQLSFGIVAGILLLYQPMRRGLTAALTRRRGLMVFRSDQRVTRWVYFRLADGGISMLALSLSAYLATMPLVAYHFGLFSPYAGILTVLLTPLIAAVLIPGYISLALAWPMPNLSVAVGNVASSMAGVTWKVSLWLGKLPGVSFDLYPVPAWGVGLFYVVLAMWVTCRRSRLILAGAIVGTVALAGGFVWTQRSAPPPANMQLDVLDVAHGSMNLLRTPAGNTVLLDAGTLGGQSAYQNVLRPFLRDQRLPAPDTAFISHANLDHYNALADLLTRQRLRRVYVGEKFLASARQSPEASALLDQLAAAGTSVTVVRACDVVDLGGGVRAEVVWPPAGLDADDNNSSLVLRLTDGQRAIVLPGDIAALAEAKLAQEKDKLAADLLVLPHHGSMTKTLSAFIEAVAPAALVQSNSFRLESPQLLEAFGGRKRFATFRDGAVRLILGPRLITVRTMTNGEEEALRPGR
jgi:competence protein ComEC